MTANYTNPQDAIVALAQAVRQVQNAQLSYDRTAYTMQQAAETLERQQALFNEVREEVIRLCPEIINGFSIGETVAVVDGQIHVVKDT